MSRLLLQCALLLLLASYCPASARKKIRRNRWLYCDTCLATMQEIGNMLYVTNPKDKVQVGGFRIDKEDEKLPAKRSEVYLSEVMDYVCGAMWEFGIFINPDTQEKHIIRAKSFQGIYAPPTTKHFKKDQETIDSIAFACLNLLEDNEDKIIDFFKHRDDDEMDQMEVKFCVEYAGLCRQSDVQRQMWAMAEAAMLGINSIEDPVPKDQEDYQEHMEELKKLRGDDDEYYDEL